MYRPLGDGEVDVGRVIDLLEQAGYRGWYVLEQDTVVETEPDEGEGPISDVRKSLEFVKERLAGARAGERGADG
jgi:inosose dehydratase